MSDESLVGDEHLLPCPFCSGKASLYTDTDTPSPMHCIMCSGCTMGTGWSMFKEMQITAWNRRAETETTRKWKECWDRSVALGLGGIPSMIAFIEAGVPDEVIAAAERMAMPVDPKRLEGTGLLGVTAQEDARCSALIVEWIKSLPRKRP